jgi:hypothetical protein
MKVISIMNNSASLCHFCIDIKEKEGSKRKRVIPLNRAITKRIMN